VASTLAPATVGEPTETLAPSTTISTWSKVICSPTPTPNDSTLSFSQVATLYCFPPVLITAYMAFLSQVHPAINRYFLLKRQRSLQDFGEWRNNTQTYLTPA
jgi:hypothetical protein